MTHMEQGLSEPGGIDINDISIGSEVVLRSGAEGVVTDICEKIIDGVSAPVSENQLAQARIFISCRGGGLFCHSYRRDGVSRVGASGDIVLIQKAQEAK